MKRTWIFLFFLCSIATLNAGFVFKHKPSDFVSSKEEVICLIYHKDKQLLFLKSPFAEGGNLWSLPKVKMHKGETYYKAVRRLLNKELGLEFSASDLIYLEKVYFVYPNTQSEAHVYKITLRHLPEKIKHSSKEFSKYKFVKEREIDRLQFFPGEKECMALFPHIKN